MAIVDLAHDLKDGRDVAIKLIRPELAAAIGRERFLRVMEIAARLRHSHIVPLHDSGEVPADGGSGASLLYYSTSRSVEETRQRRRQTAT